MFGKNNTRTFKLKVWFFKKLFGDAYVWRDSEFEAFQLLVEMMEKLEDSEHIAKKRRL